MEPTSLALQDKKKSQILDTLVRTLILAYGDKTIDYFEMKKAATYILDHFEKVRTHPDLMYFLGNLSAYWSIYKKIFTIERAAETTKSEAEVIQKLSNYIKNIPEN